MIIEIMKKGKQQKMEELVLKKKYQNQINQNLLKDLDAI